MADMSGQTGGRPEFDLQVAKAGLTLLQLQVSASDPQSQPGWVNRRVEQLEFLDTRAVRWRVSIDFIVPGTAPGVGFGDETFRLVPITSIAKTNLVAFSLRDERGSALWIPTSDETTGRLASALIYWAASILGQAPEELPEELQGDLERIVSADPGELRSRPAGPLAAAALIDAERHHDHAVLMLKDVCEQLARTRLREFRERRALWRRWARAQRELVTAIESRRRAAQNWLAVPPTHRSPACRLLAADEQFRSQMEELAQNAVIHVGVNGSAGSRRILKLDYESEFRFRPPEGRLQRVLQNLGWRCWQVDVLIGGRGGSHHLEVTAPPGVDIVGITAVPQHDTHGNLPQTWSWWHGLPSRAWWHRLVFWEPAADVSVPGYLPHVHIRPPGDACIRYRAAIFVRVSRPGWLTASWLIALVIGAVITLGRLNLPSVYSASTRAAGQADTAATLLLALLAVFATMLVRPGEHPLASRLLALARLLILTDALVILIGVGNLVLHRPDHPVPQTLWTWLAIIAGSAGLFTVTRLLPVKLRPRGD